ncbi:leucine-rich repeat domain-containing protein [Pseudomonas moraviensis]|uniref:leucine-rich repeat domain-containing protein n=1 Tax=Pseudomonas moraviensis TaxID=321662 RepID=UPI002093538E|nr:leucine-rich repeat domain-containing protein [Pseudomonas moraviensis]UST69661.1 leucine-rich repeat domain-containing protein [Pseudomonas moraviensis]
MPVKPPTGGSTPVKVDASTSPTRPTEVGTPLPGPSGRRGFGSDLFPDNPQSRAGGSSATDIDAVHPAPAVVVHAVPAETRVPVPQSSLDHYVVSAKAILPQANEEGLRVFNNRTYAEVADGEFVLVAVDQKTGLHRARRPSELLPGPVMLRDVDTGLWHQREVVEPTTRAQVKKTLAEATDEDADAFIARFDDKDVAELELKRIQLGLPQLDSKHISIPQHQNHVVQSHEVTEAFAMWGTLRQLYKWQGQPDQRVYRDGRLSGFKLDINLTLWPVDKLLPLKFNSVVSLTLRGNAPLNSEVFFAQFPNIESLTVTSQIITRRTFGASMYEFAHSRFNMDSRFAEQLTRLPRLRELSLQDCELPAGFSVRGMTELQVLRLGNTSGRTDLVAGVNALPGPLRFRVPDQHLNDFLLTNPDVTGMTELRVLDLTGTGISRIPFGLDAGNGPSRLEVLKLGDNALSVAPSLKAMTALQELDLSNTGLDRFPEGITDEIPGKVLNLANNRIASIPESVELRAGFNLSGNPITDPAALRRLIHARVKTGADIWLGGESADRSANLWLRNVPPLELSEKLKLWDSFGGAGSDVLNGIRKLSRTPEFHVEHPLLQRRVWWFLDIYTKAEPSEQARMKDILLNEPSPGKMLDRLEAQIREYDSGRQNQPLHHLPKRPKLD